MLAFVIWTTYSPIAWVRRTAAKFTQLLAVARGCAALGSRLPLGLANQNLPQEHASQDQIGHAIWRLITARP